MNKMEENLEKQEFPYFLNKEETLSIWDDPSIVGGIALPENYYPITNLMSVLSRLTNGYLDELDVTILKVLGDAICVNENQLKRYLQTKLTRTQVSERLKRLRENGFIDRWQVQSSQFPEQIKPPAPFTLGVAGYSLMKQLYYTQFFMNPNKWLSNGLPNIQRYVATNEIRCQLIERKKLKNWIWNGVILNNPSLDRPFAVAEIATPKGNMNLIIERIQQSKDYISYINKKLDTWETIIGEHHYILVKQANKLPCIIVLYVSTYSLAEYLSYKLILEKRPMNVWLCVEEELNQIGFEDSFFIPVDNGQLKKIRMDFLSKE